MSGCAKVGKSKEEIVKEALKTKYNEEFIVHSISNLSGGMDAIVSPEKKPEIVFSARINDEGSYIFDDYYQWYVARLLNDQFKEDLNDLFPEAYFRTEARLPKYTGLAPFQNMNLQEILSVEDLSEESGNECLLYIYIDESKKTPQKYDEEYYYFSKIVDDYIKEKKALPLCVTVYRVDHMTKMEIENYFRKNIAIDENYIKNILKSDDYLSGIIDSNDSDVGNPPNISLNFKKQAKTYLSDITEYKRRRELLEK